MAAHGWPRGTSIVSRCYLATTSDRIKTEYIVSAVVVVIYSVYINETVMIILVMSYRCAINPIMNSNPMPRH